MLQTLRPILKRLSSPSLPIGVDVEDGCVRMLQLEATKGGRPRVVAAGRRVLGDGRVAGKPQPQLNSGAGLAAEVCDAVRDLMGRGGFRGRRVVIAVPPHLMQFRTLRLPAVGGEVGDLPQTLAREARNALGVDLTQGEHLTHFLPGDPLRRGGETHREGLLVVVRRGDVDALVSAYDECGTVVAGVDLRPMSLYRGVQRFIRRRRDADDVHVLAHFGPRSTQVVIGRGGKMSFLKGISVGTDQLHAAVARKLGLDAADAANLCRRMVDSQPTDTAERDPVRRAVSLAMRPILEELARELALCLRYYCVTFQCKRPERVLLCGAQAEDARVVAALSTAMPVPVEARRPLEDLEIDDSFGTTFGAGAEEWDVALGLALRHAPDSLAGRAGLSRSAQAAADVADVGEAADDLPAAVPQANEEAERDDLPLRRRVREVVAHG